MHTHTYSLTSPHLMHSCNPNSFKHTIFFSHFKIMCEYWRNQFQIYRISSARKNGRRAQNILEFQSVIRFVYNGKNVLRSPDRNRGLATKLHTGKKE